MTRFRCPSASTISSSGSTASVSKSERARAATPLARFPSIAEEYRNHRAAAPAPATRAPPPARKVDKGKGRVRTTGKMDLRRRESLRMSMKKAEIKDRKWSFVFVGNLSSAVTEDQLEEKFERFGPIRLIQIRASSGVCVPTANLPRPYFGLGAPIEGTHYATIEFSSPSAARKALEYNGANFAGRNIIVSFSIIDMPETTEIMKSLVEKKKKKQQKATQSGPSLAELRTLWKIKFGQIKRLTIERTEYVDDGKKSPAAPGQVMAHFAKRIGLLPGSDQISGGSQEGHDVFTYPQTLA